MCPPESNDWLLRNGLRIAFFGGSFDPLHRGHLAVARAARDAFHLDSVLFAPVGAQPLKPEGSVAAFEDRVAMTQLAIEGECGFVISLADAPRAATEPGIAPNYTIDTLTNIKRALAPDSILYCLMGADSFFELHRWHRAAELPFVAPLIVASRPGQPREGLREALPAGLTLEPAPAPSTSESGPEIRAFRLVNSAGDRAPFYLLPGLDVEISASDIRNSVRSVSSAGGSMPDSAILPQPVARYIRSHHLYSD